MPGDRCAAGLLQSCKARRVDPEIFDKVQCHGVIEVQEALDDLLVAASDLGWKAVPLRRGDPVVSELRPLSADKARPNSLSSRTGTGTQPLHTDGAHLDAPPTVVALAATAGHPVSTRLFSMVEAVDAPWADLRHGIFRISDGRRQFLSTAMQGRSVRFDPFCMAPCDSRAQRVVDFFRSAWPSSTKHEWSDDQAELLLIDNRQVLHAREAVPSGAPPRVLRRVAFLKASEL